MHLNHNVYPSASAGPADSDCRPAALPPFARDLALARSRPELHQLAIFLTVVETRSFTAAARLMDRSQPAISQTIARLEEIYGGDLFERRRGAPLELTPIGEAILPLARTILEAVDRQMTRAVETARGQFGTLTLGFFPGLSTGPLRAAIADFAATSPKVRLRLIEGFPDDLHRQLIERTLDLMIVALMPNLVDQTLSQEPLWEERLIVALPASHTLARQAALKWHDIAGMPLILRSGNRDSIAYRALLGRIGERPIDCAQHAVSRHALLDMVAMDIGATILPESCLAPHSDVAFRSIDDACATVLIEAVWPKSDRNPLRHRFLNCIRARRNRANAAQLIPLFPATAPGADRGPPAPGRGLPVAP